MEQRRWRKMMPSVAVGTQVRARFPFLACEAVSSEVNHSGLSGSKLECKRFQNKNHGRMQGRMAASSLYYRPSVQQNCRVLGRWRSASWARRRRRRTDAALETWSREVINNRPGVCGFNRLLVVLRSGTDCVGDRERQGQCFLCLGSEKTKTLKQ